jgi:hypothetical protein
LALNLPNLDRVVKVEPKLGELLKRIQDYTNQNVATAPGNKVPKPPINAVRNTA